MYREIESFAIRADNNLYVEFQSGETGLFDIKPYLKSEFFSELKNEVYFSRAYLEFGVISWPNGQDISPDTIFHEMKAVSRPEGITLRYKHYGSMEEPNTNE